MKKFLVCLGIALGASTTGLADRSANACSPTTPLTYYGGYVDAYDTQDMFGLPHNIYFVFWGYGTYGDPMGFKAAALAEFGSPGLLTSFGIDSRKFYGVPSQYSGYDWASGVFKQITPTQGLDYITDEGNLPPPDPITGKITLNDTDIGNEADFIGNTYGLSFDDVIIVFPPPNAPPPVPGACGQHFISPQFGITAWVAYPQGGCSFNFQELAIQHELTEAVTDPAWPFGASYEGWDQGNGAFCEISDICQNLSFNLQSQQQSAAISQVTTQPELSNEAVAAGQNGCVYGRGSKAVIAGLSGNNLFVSIADAQTSLGITNGFSWGHPSGVTLTGGPGVASWGMNWLDAFIRGTNGKIYHASSFGGFTGGGSILWEQLSSINNFTRNPDAVSWGAGNIQVFGVQTNNIVRNTLNYPSGWSGWSNVNKPSGVNPSSKVTVASWGATNTSGGFPTNVHTVLAAFRGSDGKVWLGNSVDGGSFTWNSFTAPATLTGDPDLAAWAPPRLDLFVLDTSGNLWDMVSTDGINLTSNTNFGHPSTGGFQLGGSVAALGDGRLLFGGRVGSNTPWVQFFNWQTGTWGMVGFSYASQIDIAAP
jgi:hypothetical protein